MKYLLYAKHCAKCFIFINLLNLTKPHEAGIIIIIAILRMKKRKHFVFHFIFLIDLISLEQF